MSISIIVAVDENKGLGHKGSLLAHIPEDLKRFKQLTERKICFMGRKTYESIIDMNGLPLPNRASFILTKQEDYVPPKANENVQIENSLSNFIDKSELIAVSLVLIGYNPEIMICGGGEIYEQTLPHADTIYLTKIHHSFEQVDSYFPVIDKSEWDVVSYERFEGKPYDYSFIKYGKKNRKNTGKLEFGNDERK